MTDIQFRKAQASDLPAIVAKLADDPLGAARLLARRPSRVVSGWRMREFFQALFNLPARGI
ncbi:hypothetical protein [Mesorhizobium sp. B4-1-4]|uniref:hypothetical protein n=1 Tax=Mesorhizobium sp. B4-1-4 TaxID=2589888 RepID=UPI001D02445D|nr:hypothetical protein [Mesorhizobium sp. B4-1-4]UCI34258.1 hypothetical protein FJW03_12895 [Mesorhizobium sp. B4-1-4]